MRRKRTCNCEAKRSVSFLKRLILVPASILRKSTSDRHRPVSYPDGPMTGRYRFTLNADWGVNKYQFHRRYQNITQTQRQIQIFQKYKMFELQIINEMDTKVVDALTKANHERNHPVLRTKIYIK